MPVRFDNLPEPRVPHVIWIDEAPMDRRALNEWWSGLRTRPDDRTGVVFSSADSGWWGAPPDAGEVDMPTADRLKEAMEKAWASCSMWRGIETIQVYDALNHCRQITVKGTAANRPDSTSQACPTRAAPRPPKPRMR